MDGSSQRQRMTGMSLRAYARRLEKLTLNTPVEFRRVSRRRTGSHRDRVHCTGDRHLRSRPAGWRGDRARLGTRLPRRDSEPAYPVGRARGSRTVCTAKWRLHVTSHAPDGRGLGRRVSPSAGWQLDLPLRISTTDFTSARHWIATAMPNGRCRVHGGRSAGAPRGERNGN